MATVNDKELVLARVYSTAMLELAESLGEADLLLEELQELTSLLNQHQDLATLFTSPMVDFKTRRAALEKVFRGRVSDLLIDSLQVLNRKGRMGIVRTVASAYRMAHEELRGQIEVLVKTAVPLNDELRRRVASVASQVAGRQARLLESVDRSLVGGMVIHIGDQKYDMSVSSKLRRLGDRLAERASHEIRGPKEFVTRTQV